jgi:hypothetical protein
MGPKKISLQPLVLRQQGLAPGPMIGGESAVLEALLRELTTLAHPDPKQIVLFGL